MATTDSVQGNNRPFWAILTLVILIVMLVVIRTIDWSEPSGLGTVQVSVTVRQNGDLISNVMVTLFPMPHDAPMRAAAGTTGPNGRCDLTTIRFDDGAMPGPYAVGVEKVPAWSLKFHDVSLLNIDPNAPRAGTKPSQADPTRKYRMAREQESKPQAGALPADLIDPRKSKLRVYVDPQGPNDFVFDVDK